MEKSSTQQHNDDKKVVTSLTSKDPVCGMNVDTKSAKNRSIFRTKSFFFCSHKCKEKFDTSPEQYLNPANLLLLKKPEGAKHAGAEYTCPMHPQVIKVGPGACTICGMALEPVTAVAGEEGNAEYKMMLKRFWVSLIFSVPLLFVTMGGRHLIESEQILGSLKWAEVVLATPVVLWGGWPFFVRFWQSLAHRSLNMFSLIGLGVGVAYSYSVVAIFFPSVFPTSFQDSMTGELGSILKLRLLLLP